MSLAARIATLRAEALAERMVEALEVTRLCGIDPHSGSIRPDQDRPWACQLPEGRWDRKVDFAVGCRQCLFALSVAAVMHDVPFRDGVFGPSLTGEEITTAIDMALDKSRHPS